MARLIGVKSDEWAVMPEHVRRITDVLLPVLRGFGEKYGVEFDFLVDMSKQSISIRADSLDGRRPAIEPLCSFDDCETSAWRDKFVDGRDDRFKRLADAVKG